MKDFLSKIIALDNIKQWEERDSVIKESVSQHSFKVSALCVFLLEKIDHEKTPLDFTFFKVRCIEYSILHDFDESILGRDISHTVKYNEFNGENIRIALSEFVNFTLQNLGLSDLFSKFEDEDVKLFCKLCDWIALHSFIIRNEVMGVSCFAKEKEYCLANIQLKKIEVEKMLQSSFGIKVDMKSLIKL